MREDIFGGLQNALERGVPLEKAIRSFINAGYDEKEVRQAARVFTEGAISTAGLSNPPGVSSPELNNLKVSNALNPEKTQLQQTKPLKQEQNEEQPKKKRLGSVVVILLAILLVSLIGALIATIFFKQDILQFLSGLF